MCQLKSTVDAREAKSAPPLGPLLAQFQLDMLKVCKELNERTKIYETGVPLPVKIDIDEWRAYKIKIGGPRLNFLYYQLKEVNEFTIYIFYDLVKLFAFYNGLEIKKGLVMEVLASLSSMKLKKIKNVKA